MTLALEPPSKPLLRGWLHAGFAPFALLGGLALISFGPTLAGRLTAAVFTLTAIMLFGTSAVYHRGNWNPKVRATLRRLDHSNIFLIIAGTYTPLCVLLLPKNTAVVALIVVWTGAIVGLLSRVFWLDAPRWLYTPTYVALAGVGVAFTGPFYEAGGPVVIGLIAAGGLAYIVGATFYATKWPGASARYFGFHEIFHALTIVGFVCHYIAASIAIYGA